MSDLTLPHEIWATQGQGEVKIAAFMSEHDAKIFMKRILLKRWDASYCLRYLGSDPK